MSNSAFAEIGLKSAIDKKIKEIQQVYLADDIPWVVGYSGGKDSSASLQLTWEALRALPKEKRHKQIHVITTDTLVENPIVANWVKQSLKRMELAAVKEGLPISVNELEPTIEDTFWVNLLGKGYPAPRQKFRWCTLRLKISPSNRFIHEVVSSHGEAIVVLGTRSSESAARAKVIEEHKELRKKNGFHLSPNSVLENCFIYSPIEEWSNDDVWAFLMSYKNSWGHDNSDLMNMYRGATSGGECPLVVDTNTESCGKSRFGCWICTLVDEDKSMTAMIANDQEKEWLTPLLEFRNSLDFRSEEGRARDHGRRDFRRMDGHVYLYNDRLVRGPYHQQGRAELLELLLEVEIAIQESAPRGFENYEIITEKELREIRRIWVEEKHEVEDLLPQIYSRVKGKPFDDSADYRKSLRKDVFVKLKELCGENRIQYERIREMLCVEQKYRAKAKRHGIILDLEKAEKRSFYVNETDAQKHAAKKYTVRQAYQQAREDSSSIEQMKDLMAAGACK
jgi:DNA sulfur modification protein DndC